MKTPINGYQPLTAEESQQGQNIPPMGGATIQKNSSFVLEVKPMSDNTNTTTLETKSQSISKRAVSEALHASAYLEQAQYAINGMTFHFSRAILETELDTPESQTIRKAYFEVYKQLHNARKKLEEYALLDPILYSAILDLKGGE